MIVMMVIVYSHMFLVAVDDGPRVFLSEVGRRQSARAMCWVDGNAHFVALQEVFMRTLSIEE